MISSVQNKVTPARLNPVMDEREYIRHRRKAKNGRPLLRQGGGRKLGFVLEWCRGELRISKGALARTLAEELGTTRGRIYRVMRQELGLSPDALWRLGAALRKIGVRHMSGPLALAIEPRYDAHLLGVVGELVLDPMHFEMRGFLYDFLWHRSWFSNQDQSGIKHIRHYGYVNPTRHDMFDAAWQRWYAFNASELATKEREEHFANVAPCLSRAVSLLRAQQRRDDSTTYERSYRILLHVANKDIRAYFDDDGDNSEPLYRRLKYPVEVSPRFELLSNHRFGTTEFGKRLRELIAPSGNRVLPAEAYRNGWANLKIPEASGLLALAVLDYEREYYLLVARILKPIAPSLERLKRGEQTRSDIDELRRLKTWWKPLWVISCLVGPLDRDLASLSKELAYVLEGRFDVILRDEAFPSVHCKVSDLHNTLFSDSSIGDHLRKMITLPKDAAKMLSKYSVTSDYTPSDYDSLTTPEGLATVLDMLHQPEFEYPTETIRTELFWWFGDVEKLLDGVD